MSVKPFRTTQATKKAVSPQTVKNGKILPSTTKAVEPQIRTLSDLEREDLITSSRLKARKLGRSILRKWNARLDLQEVDSIVDLSLCEAAARFDPSVGASFLTFLFYHLRGNLIRAIS